MSATPVRSGRVTAAADQRNHAAIAPRSIRPVAAANQIDVERSLRTGGSTAARAPGCLPDSDSSFSSSSATFTSAMCWNRLDGSFRLQRRMTRSTSAGRSLTISPMRFGSSRRIAVSVEICDVPSNALRPLSISYSTEPKLKMSERASTALPSACSGDM